ncbi:Toll/interleukin-1 receptor homology (TIR) domain [Arabidopsis thaliana x Arabidopsis arenosa]|uniref:Toll/interleukin-1 receptor homology (TIR) domain n=1 Tax=Arabidopsis thaliana x Arabidopsis arenosa TaxID=1240361 RepID=A0A8T2DY12_9BRAS|nr:Toll/interleukin-1 receptor homology (TIR) domain [Arabidopsis thaliana x Arabidopsis arenosa]
MVDGKEVYISFNRWEDTIRHSFVSHLSAEFQRKGVSVFASEDSASDDRFAEESDAAIAKARVSVVIFSENFASSKGCLNEFLKVSKCRRSKGLVVVPVFYGLTNSIVKKHCLELKKMYPDDKVDEWRNALWDIADLRGGHVSSHKRSDSELVEKIVADVRQKLDRRGRIGVYSRLTKIEYLLCKQPGCIIRSLGIWGMAGIGKTTLARAAYDQLSRDFEASCFIEDFDREFQEKGFFGLLEKQLGVNPQVTRLSILLKTLRSKRILLVLDDVRKPLGATSFLCEFDWLGPGSLIIVTSQDKQVLVQCQVNEIYKVQGLNKHESLQLFSRCAFGKDVPDQNLLELSMKFVDYANGNPLALSICGKNLKGKTPLDMKSVVLELKRHLSDKIFVKLKSSYDALSVSEKEIFLDIVFTFRGANVDNVMQSLAGCGFFPRVGIEALVDKSFVTVSENRVQVNNLIYDVGLKIINDQSDEIGMCYRFVDASNSQSLIEHKEIRESEQGYEDVKAINLDTSNLPFKGDPQFLPPELRLLHWTCYPLHSFPQNFGVQYLVELNMPCSKLKKLWGGTKNLEVLKRITLSCSVQLLNVDELQYSPNIEKIDLKGCLELQSFPDTGQLQHLRIVDLSTCKKIKSFPKVPPSIRKLHLQGTGIRDLSSLNHSSESQRLTRKLENVSSSNQDHRKQVLKLKDSSHLGSLPDIVIFESLEVLDFSGCSELEDIQGFPQNLKRLYLAKTAIKEVPSSLCHHISKLVKLDMENCERLRDLPMGMSNMKYLAVLKLSGCSNLENIKELPRNLKELYLAGTAVKEFPSTLLETLSEVVLLDLENCKKLQGLPTGMSKLEFLVTLKLSGCSKLEIIVDLPLNLIELYLAGTAIRELPPSIGDLALLDTLDLKNCNRLRHLPMEMHNLNPLKVLDLSNCSELEVFTSSLPKVRELRPAPTVMLLRSKLPFCFFIFYEHRVTLSLYKARLQYIPEEIRWMPSLKTLDLSRNGFTEVPVSIKDFSKLLSLRLRYCENLRSLPQLPRSLQLLNAHGCSSLQLITPDFKQLPRYYTFSNCFGLPSHMVSEVLANAPAIVECRKPQQGLENALACSFCLPSPTSRDSKLYLQPGSSTMIILNPKTRSTLVGFAILVEVSFSKDFHDTAGLGFRCVCRWNDKKGHAHKRDNIFHCWAPGEVVPKINDDHMFVFFDLKMHPSILFEGDVFGILADLVVFEIFPVNKQEMHVGDSCTITKCGVYVINDAAGSSSGNTMTPQCSSMDSLKLLDGKGKKRLRVNYAGLKQREKALFLYIACLLGGEKADLLAQFLASTDFVIESTLEDLAGRYLIDISSNGEVMMPPLQRNFSREIIHMLPASTKELVSMASGSPCNRNNDVFVSFHGKDFRKQFIRDFLKKLVYKGIRICIGDKILSRSLINKVIKESSIAVVVFSENYASSSFCLLQLMEIMKCREELGQVVMPIFYKVNPSDIQNQSGHFGKGFKKFCKKRRNDERQRWSRALNDAASITGECSLKWASDADMIEKVANDIWKKLISSKQLGKQIQRVDCDHDNPWETEFNKCIELFFQLPYDGNHDESPVSLTTEKIDMKQMLKEIYQITKVKLKNNLVARRKLSQLYDYISCKRN